MQDLLLTLGHNASALTVDENGQLYGYEQERFDRQKSSSAFPKDAILQLIDDGKLSRNMPTKIYVSHWFDHRDIIGTKYFDITFLNDIFNKKIEIIQCGESGKTHHDAHAASVLCFAKEHTHDISDFNILVADGFGNKQEVISVYTIDKFGRPKLKDRFYGYKQSLGLLYQSATSYCGMKENRDEYKFLGYESNIKEVLNFNSLYDLTNTVINNAFIFTERLMNSKNKSREHLPETNGGTSEFGPVINFKYLIESKKFFCDNYFDNWLNIAQFEDASDIFKRRVVIGYAVQLFVETVMQQFCHKYNFKNLMTCGGLFYNVKLNNTILNFIPGKYITHPINGDQGAAVGLYKLHNHLSEVKFGDMILGTTPDKDDLLQHSQYYKRIIVGDEDDLLIINQIAGLLSDGAIVNIMREGQEFGPRALCHTSTLALPRKKYVDMINKMNDRNEVMPMAPVITSSELQRLYDNHEYSKVIGSDKFMVITYHTKIDKVDLAIYGVIHQDPIDGSLFTSRPQVLYEHEKHDAFMMSILRNLMTQILINTSFNYHGEPIILTKANAVETFNRQCRKAEELGFELPYLFILTKGE